MVVCPVGCISSSLFSQYSIICNGIAATVSSLKDNAGLLKNGRQKQFLPCVQVINLFGCACLCQSKFDLGKTSTNLVVFGGCLFLPVEIRLRKNKHRLSRFWGVLVFAKLNFVLAKTQAGTHARPCADAKCLPVSLPARILT